jgi:hypothetical protein
MGIRDMSPRRDPILIEKLNKLKKTSPEAFFYYYRALELLNPVGK